LIKKNPCPKLIKKTGLLVAPLRFHIKTEGESERHKNVERTPTAAGLLLTFRFNIGLTVILTLFRDKVCVKEIGGARAQGPEPQQLPALE
jgi:hypothetical protein